MLKRLAGWLKPGKDYSAISIKISPDHSMIKMARALDWAFLMTLVAQRRQDVKSHLGGPQPHVRELLGALLVRTMKSCTLREAVDLIAHYGPARILCDLQDSDWTPNFRTLSDFEIMLGADVLQKINAYILDVARQLGFADIKGLCADTTAQEAQIPYPNEVGLMGSFAKSIEAGIDVLGKTVGKAKSAITESIEEVKKLVRKYRLFAKTKELKTSVSRSIFNATKRLLKLVRKIPAMSDGGRTLKTLKKAKKSTVHRFVQLCDTTNDLLPQIDYFIKKGKVAPNKIISLFLDGVRSIVRGKAGKKSEFGLKWGVNQIRGGYVSLFLMSKSVGEADYAVAAVERHIAMFGEAPKEFGYDRGGWSEKHLKKIAQLGVKKVAVAPKGKAKWLVSNRCKDRMVNERAQVEGKIGTLKAIGFNKPHAKTTAGMIRSAHRAEIGFNIGKLMRDAAMRNEMKSKKVA
jgi:hypothetical protein